MKLPKFYLVQSKLSEENKERVRAALSILPSAGTFVFTDDDAKLAQEITDAPVVSVDAPMAIVGEFTSLLTAVNSDGTVETLL